MQLIIHRNLILYVGILFLILGTLNVSLGKAANSEIPSNPKNVLVNNDDKNQQTYVEDVQEQLQKSRELLEDLQDMRAHASNEERKQDLYEPIMKLTKELEHAERVSKKLDVFDPEPWLRNKSEMDAVLADLEVAYEGTFPLLQDQTKFLQEAVYHANVAVEYGKEQRKDLFLKHTQSAKHYASLAQQQGMNSDFVKEGISKLENALSHITQNRLGAAATLTQGAYLHLNSALKNTAEIE